jgi:hypothetical protein
MDHIEGTSPDGSPVRVDLSGTDQVVYLMTSSCKPCLGIWPALREGDVAVTPSPSTESTRKVKELAPEGVTVVMSSDLWFALRPGPAPWRVRLVDGVVVESGSALSGQS